MTLYGLELPDDWGDNGNGNGECCDCAELLDSKGVRRPTFPGHDCEYVRQRSALVPQAVKIANERVAVCSPQDDAGREPRNVDENFRGDDGCIEQGTASVGVVCWFRGHRARHWRFNSFP